MASYGFAIICVLGAFGGCLALMPVLGPPLPLALFVLATWLVAYCRGVWPGVFALLLGSPAGGYLLVQTPRAQGTRGSGELTAILAYVCTAAAGVALIGALLRARRTAETLRRDIDGLRLKIAEHARTEQALQRARQQLAQHARDLEARVVERTSKLEESLRSLEGVLYHVAHDLRAPLRAMEGFAQILLEGQARRLDLEGKDYARRIITSASYMDQLIKDLLAYGRLAHMEVPCDTVDLESEVTRVLENMAEEIRARRAQIEIHRPLPPVWANPAVLEQVLASLLSNALKFVDANVLPHVKLGARHSERMVRVWVQDNGIGIEETHRDQIFQIFGRLHNADTYPGTGIGLALVRKGAERMGGMAGVDSAPGKGSCFWVELPANPIST